MKIMDLARMIYTMGVDETIDFAAGTEDEVAYYGDWWGIKYCNPFDNDNPAYIVGHYGGEANTWFYQISEYDEHIGDFCEKQLNPWDKVDDKKRINCIAKMLVDVFERTHRTIPEEVTVEIIKEET